MDHETDYYNHGHAGHDVCVVLDDELVTKYGQILVGGSLSAFDWGHFRNGAVPQQLHKYRCLVTYLDKTWRLTKTAQTEDTKSTTVSG